MLAALTLIHVAISLVAIATGLVFAADLLVSRERPAWTQVFLWMTIATSVTGFLFPVERITPAHVFGVISLAVLAVTLWSHRRLHEEGTWRKTYIATALFALYLNVFVLVVQMFQKIAPLKALAPTQTEPAFGLAQGAVLLGFLYVGFRAVKQFRPAMRGRMASAGARG